MKYIILIVAVLLMAYALRGTFRRLTGKGGCCSGGGELVLKNKVEDRDKSHYPYQYKLAIDGMVCNNCANKVGNAINDMGDTWATVDHVSNSANVLSKSELDRDALAKVVRKAGYTVMSFEQV